jgi:hypothetical protein
MVRTAIRFVVCFLALGAATTFGQQDVGPTYEHLKDLEHFVGDWELEGVLTTGDVTEELSVIASYRWLQNKSFMLVTLEDTRTKEIPYVGVLGWDPDKKHLMSWDFNLLGTIFTYYQGKSDEGWWLRGTGRMPDGAKIEYEGKYRFVDDNTMNVTGSGIQQKDGEKTALSMKFTSKRLSR